LKRRSLFIIMIAAIGATISGFFSQYVRPEKTLTTVTTSQPKFQRKKIANISELQPDSYIVFNWPEEMDRYHVNILIRGREGNGMGSRRDLYAYNLICTHQQCPVEYNKKSSQLECPCHGSIFDPYNDAKVLSGPAKAPLAKIVVEEDDNGDIYAVDIIGEPGKGR
jgi:arsenite oxidase small subunit